jgi:hypothetical protein
VKIREGDDGEAILSSSRVVSLYKSSSVRSFLETEANRETRRGEGIRIPKLAPWTRFKVGQIWAPSRGQGF